MRECRALVMQRFVDDVQRDMTRREQRTKAALEAAGLPKSKLLDRCLQSLSIICSPHALVYLYHRAVRNSTEIGGTERSLHKFG
jgi:hypothetical protein